MKAKMTYTNGHELSAAVAEIEARVARVVEERRLMVQAADDLRALVSRLEAR